MTLYVKRPYESAAALFQAHTNKSQEDWHHLDKIRRKQWYDSWIAAPYLITKIEENDKGIYVLKQGDIINNADANTVWKLEGTVELHLYIPPSPVVKKQPIYKCINKRTDNV